jgi:hypothetical protein
MPQPVAAMLIGIRRVRLVTRAPTRPALLGSTSISASRGGTVCDVNRFCPALVATRPQRPRLDRLVPERRSMTVEMLRPPHRSHPLTKKK